MTVRTKAGPCPWNKGENNATHCSSQALGKHSGVEVGALLEVEEPEDASSGKWEALNDGWSWLSREDWEGHPGWH